MGCVDSGQVDVPVRRDVLGMVRATGLIGTAAHSLPALTPAFLLTALDQYHTWGTGVTADQAPPRATFVLASILTEIGRSRFC